MNIDFSKIGKPFFERDVYSESLGASLSVEMWLPINVEINHEGVIDYVWVTAVRISSGGKILREDEAHGTDKFQSITMGLVAINMYLTHKHKDACWLGMKKGSHGFPEIDTNYHIG